MRTDTERIKAEAAWCTNSFTSMMGTSSLFCLSAGNKHQRRDNNKNSITPVPVSHWFLIISLSVLSVCLSSHHHIKTLLTHYTVFNKQPAGRHYCVYKQQQANSLFTSCIIYCILVFQFSFLKRIHLLMFLTDQRWITWDGEQNLYAVTSRITQIQITSIFWTITFGLLENHFSILEDSTEQKFLWSASFV